MSSLTIWEEAALSGPTVAIDVDQLYRAQRLPMIRLATLLVDTVPAAEDVVHDAFANLHANLDRLRDNSAAVAYLRTSVVNGCRSALRRRGTARRFLRAAEPDVGEAADARLLLSEEHREVVAAIRTLPGRQQEVVVLRYWAQLSEAEIAATLGISTGAVKSHASRAMSKIESILGGSR